MSGKAHSFDRTFLVLTAVLAGIGLLSFLSGAFFLFSQNSGIFWSTVIRHVGLGLLGAFLGYIIFKTTTAKGLMISAPWVAGATLILAILVFIPGVGSSHGTAAVRWISLGGLSIQPAEFLKIGAVMGTGWWLASRRHLIGTVWGGLVPFWVIIGVLGVVLLFQPDTDGFLVLVAALIAMYVFAGAPFKHVIVSGCVVLLLGGLLIAHRPYLKDRLDTFINPEQGVLSTSYQVRQSLIAIGSGGITGRGYGKGIHKYKYLPEPMSDALFAVIGEEWGVLGTSLVVVLFFLWYVRALALAARVTSFFSRFVILGFAHIVIIQAYLNILSNVGLFPFSGLPLPFMSQGGTALFTIMVIVGLIGALAKTNIVRARA